MASSSKPHQSTVREGEQTQQDERSYILVQYAYRHMDFQLAELESILDLFGLLPYCEFHPLPNDHEAYLWNDRKNNNGICFQIYNDALEKFKETFIKKMVQQQGEDAQQPSSLPWKQHRPFLILSFPKILNQTPSSFESREEQEARSLDAVIKALSRCVLVRSIIELWGCGSTLDACANNVRSSWCSEDALAKSASNTNHLIQKHCIDGDKSWKLTVHTFGSKYTRDEQNQMRSKFAFLPFTGKVLMENPDDEYILIREIVVDELGSPLYPRHSHKRVIIPENDARPPLAVYFGRMLSAGLREGRVDKYCLNKRKYLGPTSMDTELSMIMTNLGQVKKGTFCFDPFVGTGSILLTCALEGAFCFGTDIDIRVLRGKGNDENIYANFKQFNLPPPEIVRSDNSIYHRHYQHHNNLPLFETIVCDPPYGIRAGARKTGSKLDQPRPIADEHRHDHIAQTRPYVVSDVMADLLDVSARNLVMHGRLVYIIPSMFNDFDPSIDLPRHECLECLHVCYQPLQTNLGRRMVVMKKVIEYDEELRERYREGTWFNGPESADKCANIREKLIEAAKLKPGYEEKKLMRNKKRKAKKEEIKMMKKLGGSGTYSSITTSEAGNNSVG